MTPATAAPADGSGRSVRLLARCVRGLEWVCAAEIQATLPTATEVTIGRREVTFTLSRWDPAVLGLRTVDDVFLVLGRAGDVGSIKADLPGLARRVAGFDWAEARSQVEQFRHLALAAAPTGPEAIGPGPGTDPTTDRPSPPPDGTAFDVVASLDGGRSFSRFDVEHAVGAVVAGPLGGTYLPRSADGRPGGDPDLSVRVFVRGDGALTAVRLTRRPLHRREYKQHTGRGTLHPPVAAALCQLASPQPGQTFTDLFCGDGTIAIEAALSTPGLTIRASDLDPARVANARQNASLAGVSVEFRQADAGRRARMEPEIDVLVSNPPWNVTVDGAGSMSGSLAALWPRLRTGLSAEGRFCLLTDSALAAPEQAQSKGFHLIISTQIRVAGRVCDILLGTAGDRSAPRLGDQLTHWRQQALANGMLTDDGF